MVVKTTPEVDKVYFITKRTLYHILEGSGGIEVDFKNYYDWQDKLIYLEKGQYIKFLSDDFLIRKIEFENEELFNSKEVRVLFKHLVSLGYINFDDCADCKTFLNSTVFNSDNASIVDVSSKQWFWQNPFNASKEEYHIIFDIKEVIDREFQNHLNQNDVIELINSNGYSVHQLLKNKIGLTIHGMLSHRLLLESKKSIAFTDKNIQEVSYELGYSDPSYFNRVFKKQTGQSPNEFRELFSLEQRDLFIQDLIQLLKIHHQEHHTLQFYADKMHMSVKGLSKKVRVKMNASLGQLIRHELIISAQRMLSDSQSVVEISRKLNFEEPNHFTRFFKRYTGQTPTEYRLAHTSVQ